MIFRCNTKSICVCCVLWYLSVTLLVYFKIPNDAVIKYISRDIGEMGDPVYLPAKIPEYINRSVNLGWQAHAFNEFVSNIISVKRQLADYRLPKCREPNRYLEDLPATDVIIIFHNEAWSTLLRTVHSVLNRSPENLLNHVILVDDFSNMNHTKSKLVDYWHKEDPRVKIFRTERRVGIVQARLLGFKHSSAPVLTFLDSHCECTDGWLEPLLDRITRTTNTIVCPRINKIARSTFRYELYKDKYDIPIGGFNWNLEFKWFSLLDRQKGRKTDLTEPVETPVMAGGLFSIRRDYFEMLGTYDPDFDIWGGENMELSFRAWMCGGRIEVVPCSHVGHIFRARSPYKWRYGRSTYETLMRNQQRVAEVWMDDFKHFYYQRVQLDRPLFIDENLSERKELRKKLNCQSFLWYLDNVYPEQFRPDLSFAHGQIQAFNQRSCMHVDLADDCKDNKIPVDIDHCIPKHFQQWFIYLHTLEIRRDDCCLEAFSNRDVVMTGCKKFEATGKRKQLWELYGQQIRLMGTKQCLTAEGRRVILQGCNITDDTQKWHLDN